MKQYKYSKILPLPPYLIEHTSDCWVQRVPDNRTANVKINDTIINIEMTTSTVLYSVKGQVYVGGYNFNGPKKAMDPLLKTVDELDDTHKLIYGKLRNIDPTVSGVRLFVRQKGVNRGRLFTAHNNTYSIGESICNQNYTRTR